MQELTKTSVSGVSIDGDVLYYLEIAQVSTSSLQTVYILVGSLVFFNVDFFNDDDAKVPNLSEPSNIFGILKQGSTCGHKMAAS